MKILVFGHSDSDGSHLPDSADAFPWQLQRMLKDVAGIECDVVHRLVYAGPTAAAFVQRQSELCRPDVVIISTTTHNVVVRLVSSHMRARWGERPARLAERSERWTARQSVRGGARGSAFLLIRRAARRLFGTRTAMTVEEMIASYEDCLGRLARIENLHTIVGGGIGYIGDIRALNPGLDEAQARLQKSFREIARTHRFDWLSHETVLGGPAKKHAYYQSDGMHTDARSQRLFAEALLPLVLDRSSAAGASR